MSRSRSPEWRGLAPRSACVLADAEWTTETETGGSWRIALPPQAAGGPVSLRFTSEDAEIRVDDVLFGDVWLCSGQSNMEWPLADSLGAAEAIAASDDPRLRHIKVPRSWSAHPEVELAGGEWAVASPATVGSWSGVAYFFGRSLRGHLGVPIGLVNSTWGGARLEPWMSAESLGLDAAGVGALLAAEKEYARAVLANLHRRLGQMPPVEASRRGDSHPWAEIDLDTSDWPEMPVPARWEEVGFEGMDGVLWYRTELDLDAPDVRRALRLGLPAIDDSDETWFNGQRIGSTTLDWNHPRLYEVPPGLARQGRNAIAIRVEDTGGGGGIWGDADDLFLELDGLRRPLSLSWRFRAEGVRVDLDGHKNEVPVVLFNRMIAPLTRLPIRGVLWYQGESNAGPDDAFAYREHFQQMIVDWRARWGSELPFLWAQLASFLPEGREPAESSWAVLRESQSAALALPATAQVVLTDAGDPRDIHPRDKRTVGERFALAARAVAYGEAIEHSGPVPSEARRQERTIRLAFDHAIGGLRATGGLPANGDGEPALEGFALAAHDGRFHPAVARLEGAAVVVEAEAVAEPAAIRYGWCDDPSGANLANGAGLPASPFRLEVP